MAVWSEVKPRTIGGIGLAGAFFPSVIPSHTRNGPYLAGKSLAHFGKMKSHIE